MRRFIVLISALLLSASLSAQALDMMATIPADKDVRVGKLTNGMTYYIRHNAKPEKQAEFYIFHNVGAMQEEDSQVGLAHFLEHMAFNGTKNMPDKNIINYLETIGVKFGANLNAGTGQEMTVYNMSSVPVTREGIIDTALLILHDWSYFITLDPKEIDKERGVIIEERRTRNSPNFRMSKITDPVLYNNTKYAYRDIIGTEENLRNFPYKDLTDFYHRWYRTDQQAIVVVGDIDLDAIEAKLKTLMADIPAVENPEPKAVIPIPANEQVMVAVATDPEQPSSMATLYIKCETLPREVRDKVIARKVEGTIDLMATMLNDRLKEISQKPNAPFVDAGVRYGSLTSTSDVVMATVMARDGELPKAFEALYTEVERVMRHQFTQGEFERAVENNYRGAQKKYDNSKDRRNEDYVWPYITNFYAGYAMPDDKTDWQLDSTILKTATIAELNGLTKGVFTPNNQVVIVKAPAKEGVFVPTEKDMLDVIAKVRASAIEPYADNSVKEPLVSVPLKGSAVKKTAEGKLFGTTEWTLANGVKVVFKNTSFRSDELIMYAFSGGGMSIVPTDQYVTGEIIQPFLSTSGVGKFSATELAKQLSGKAVSVNPSINEFTNGLNAKCSPKDVQTMLQLVYLYFAEPRFERDDFTVFIDRLRAAYTNMGNNPDYIFQDSLMATLYKHNPRRELQSLKTLDQVKFEYIAPIYKSLFNGANNFTFLFVGAIDEEVLKPMVEKYIGSIATTKDKLTWENDNVVFAQGKVTNEFSVAMQTPKTTVGYVYTAPTEYTKKSIIAMSMLKQILDIRCTESIREEKGGTYGVAVSGQMLKVPTQRATLTFMFDTDPKMAHELMPILEGELQKIASSGAKTEDLSKIKEFMLKQRKDDLKTNRLWLNMISDYDLYGINMNEDYEGTVSAMTSEDLKAFAASILASGNECRVIMKPKE